MSKPGCQAAAFRSCERRGAAGKVTAITPKYLRSILALAGVCLSLAVYFPATIQGQATRQPPPGSLTVDATAPVAVAGPSLYKEGTFTSKSGATLTLNRRYLVLNGKPWLPVMGEFHYSRVPEQEWEPEILKMKAAGVQIVSAYVIWIHHEEIEGQFDWTGRRDLRHFLELCARHHMYVLLRIGPWVHGEVRNGGFPDWLVAKVPRKELRTDTPLYMAYVQKYYEQIARQADGLLWKDAGPVIGIQLENEYSGRGQHGGEEYILALKRLAIESGFDVPLYMVTGWDGAVVPEGAVLPVYGGYPDAPWDASLKQLPPSEVYDFRFASRVRGGANLGFQMAGAARALAAGGAPSSEETPFMTVEIGGGVEDTYHRRPTTRPDDVAAMCPVMLGSGVNLYGTYMFQGGENPEGKLSTLQESLATGYPNDLPVKSYDFQAPLGEFGQERESFRKLKLYNYFLNDFGEDLAPMAVRPPEQIPAGPADFSQPRLSVRTNGDAGFIFWNNYVRNYTMPAWSNAQVTVRLPQETLRIPSRPVTIPSGAYFIWPFNLDLDGVRLKYATAQLFTKLDSSEAAGAPGGATTYFFIALPGIPAEFAFDQTTFIAIHARTGHLTSEAGIRYVSGLIPGLNTAITLRTKHGGEVRIVLLSQDQAESAWKATIDGSAHLVFTQQQFFADEAHLYLQSLGSSRFDLQVLPGLGSPILGRGLSGSHALRTVAQNGGVTTYAAVLPAERPRFSFAKIREAEPAPPIPLVPRVPGGKTAVAKAPEDAAFNNAATWRIAISWKPRPDVSNLFLDVAYVGDVARLYAGDRLLEDNFYNGLPWQIGLDRFRDAVRAGPLELKILPLRKDAPVFLETRSWPVFPKSGQTIELQSIKLLPEYQLMLDSGPQPGSE